MQAQRGMRSKLEQYVDTGKTVEIALQAKGKAIYDYACFGVDAAGKLSDDRYMVFYNQPCSPAGEIRWQDEGGKALYGVQLSKLPSFIDKLVFTVSIDGEGVMDELADFCLTISQDGNEKLRLVLRGADFAKEKAIIAAEMYRKDGWRVNFVARGFNGGLDALLMSYGGELLPEEDGQAATANVPNEPPSVPVHKVSLDKKISKGAPKLVSLVKPLKIELEKRHLENVTARVALVLDISGSMVGRYNDGTVQEIINKTVPLAVHFDDDGDLDCWYYAASARRMAPVTMDNYEQAVPKDWRSMKKELGGRNNEPLVMRDIIGTYETTDVPAYIIFITDGGFASKKEIRKLMIEASHLPIFWQFLGVGGKNYGLLEELDDLEGRFIDNANFFAVDDFRTVPNETLYARLLSEFPQWLREAQMKGIIGRREI